MRKLYYAVGGGMGHLSRGRAVAHTLGWSPEEVHFVSASPYAEKILGEWQHTSIPAELAGNPSKLRRWLQEWLDAASIQEIYLDTFPVGLWGEWNEPWPDHLTFYGVFRYLKWKAYASWISEPPRFKESFQVEAWAAPFQEFVRQHSEQITPLRLQYPVLPLSPTQKAELEAMAQPLWLIVHSRPADEVEALIEMALDQARMEGIDAQLLVISQEIIDYPGVMVRSWAQAPACFPHVTRIFTGAGFNLMAQTRSFREKHFCLPFVRRYDDQFWRRNETSS